MNSRTRSDDCHPMIRSNAPLAAKLLTQVLDDHRKSIRHSGGTNYLAATFAGEVSLLWEFNGLVRDFRRLVKRIHPNVWSRIFRRRSSIEWNHVTKAMFTIRRRHAILKSYPELTDVYLDQLPLERYGDLDFDEAFATAKTELDKECVLLTQAVSGQIDKAVAGSERLAESHRRWNVVFVATIEALRHGDRAKGTALYDSLPPWTLSDWGAPQMALGISGHAAWGGYPYPDY